MKLELLDAMLASPVLPELLHEAEKALLRERELREKFYAEITPEHKWEFIQGEVIMHSPALHRHLLASQRIFTLATAYVSTRKCGQVCIEKAMTVFPRNDYEPDIVFFGPTKSGLIHPDTLKFPIPDLIVEVFSPSTEARDRGIKFQDYALHGVAEYWIVDPVAETVELYRLTDDTYPPTERFSTGTITSAILPGFTIPVRAIFDEEENLTALRAILNAD